jgi:hypothetical protein
MKRIRESGISTFCQYTGAYHNPEIGILIRPLLADLGDIRISGT